MTEQKEPEIFGLTPSEWLIVAKTGISAASISLTTIKATKKKE